MEEDKQDSDLAELNMKEFLELIVKAIVDKPEEVNVTEVSSDRTVIFELKVNTTDKGLVIGRKGLNIHAIRTLLNAASGKRRKRTILEIIK